MVRLCKTARTHHPSMPGRSFILHFHPLAASHTLTHPICSAITDTIISPKHNLNLPQDLTLTHLLPNPASTLQGNASELLEPVYFGRRRRSTYRFQRGSQVHSDDWMDVDIGEVSVHYMSQRVSRPENEGLKGSRTRVLLRTTTMSS